MQYALNRVRSLNEFCVICDEIHVIESGLIKVSFVHAYYRTTHQETAKMSPKNVSFVFVLCRGS